MHSNEGTKDTVPVFYRTAGSDRLIPCPKQLCHHGLPSGCKISGQFLCLWLQDRSPQPGPPDQMHGGLSQLIDGSLQHRIEVEAVAYQTGKRQLHMMEQPL